MWLHSFIPEADWELEMGNERWEMGVGTKLRIATFRLYLLRVLCLFQIFPEPIVE